MISVRERSEARLWSCLGASFPPGGAVCRASVGVVSCCCFPGTGRGQCVCLWPSWLEEGIHWNCQHSSVSRLSGDFLYFWAHSRVFSPAVSFSVSKVCIILTLLLQTACEWLKHDVVSFILRALEGSLFTTHCWLDRVNTHTFYALSPHVFLINVNNFPSSDPSTIAPL